MKYLILAGGRSTRLHNKLLMCLLDGRPLICSSIDTYLWFGVVPTICLNKKDQKRFTTILSNLYPGNKFQYETDEYSGLVPLLNKHLEEDDVTVLCGDNTYSNTILEYIRPGEARVVTSTNSQLDVWDGRQWKHRSNSGTHKLATPWMFKKGSASSAKDLVDLLNLKQIEPVVVSTPYWADLGTPENLERYYQRL